MKNVAEQIKSAGFAVAPSILDEVTLGILEQALPRSLGARGGIGDDFVRSRVQEPCGEPRQNEGANDRYPDHGFTCTAAFGLSPNISGA